MAGRVEGRVAIVTGGARGQGAAHGELLAREGATVVIADVIDAAGEEEAARLKGDGLKVEYAHLDVSKPDQWAAVVGTTEERHGKVDVLVNNAGIARYADAVECTDDEWDLVIAVNQSGVFYGIRAVVPAMRRAGGGSIVNTASSYSFASPPGYAAYVASKHAVVGLTRSAALSYGEENIRVNAVAPGFVDSQMTTDEIAENPEMDVQGELDTKQVIHRMGKPMEIARGVLFLASDESSYVTGTVLVIDGGYLAQ